MIQYKNTGLCLILAVLFTGCSSVPKTELQNLPSLIEIVALDLPNSQIKIRVSHRNRTTRENIQLSCQLVIKDEPALQFSAVPIPDLTTYAIETITINLTSELAYKDTELSYVLDCFLISENFRKEHLMKKATLFQVPGTPGEFR